MEIKEVAIPRQQHSTYAELYNALTTNVGKAYEVSLGDLTPNAFRQSLSQLRRKLNPELKMQSSVNMEAKTMTFWMWLAA